MPSDWWSYEPKSIYNRRQAQLWKQEAGRRTANYLSSRYAEMSGIDPSTLTLPRTAMDSSFVNAPEQKGGGSGGLLGDLVDVGEFVLKPVARLFEAENKYISGPLARGLYSDVIKRGVEAAVPGRDVLPDYNELPEPIRFAVENLLSPSTWIAPTAVLRLGKAIPTAARAIPSLGAMAPGVGSRAGLTKLLEANVIQGSMRGTAAAAIAAPFGGELAEEVGLPNILGQGVGGLAGYQLGKGRPTFTLPRGARVDVVNPDDMRVYHGTQREFDGLPSVEASGGRFGKVSRGAVFTSTDPERASFYAENPEDFGAAAHGEAPGGRVIPMVLKKGTKYFDPDVDEWPVFVSDNGRNHRDVQRMWQNMSLRSAPHRGIFMDWVVSEQRGDTAAKMYDALRKQGYQAIKTADSIVVLDEKALRPLYEYSDVHKYIGGAGDAKRDQTALRKELESARKALGKADDLDERFGPEGNFYRAMDKLEGKYQPSYDLTDALTDSIETVNLIKKFKSGNYTAEDVLRGEELLAKQAARSNMMFGGEPGPMASMIGEGDLPSQEMQSAYLSRINASAEPGIKGHSWIDSEGLKRPRSADALNRRLKKGNQWELEDIENSGPKVVEEHYDWLQHWQQATEESIEALQRGENPRDVLEPLTAELKDGSILEIQRLDVNDPNVYKGNFQEALISMREQQQRFARTLDLERKYLSKHYGYGPGTARADEVWSNEDPDDIRKMMTALNALPDPMMRVPSVEDLTTHQVAWQTITQRARQWVDDNAPEQLKAWMQNRNWRMVDDDSSHIIMGYRDLANIAHHQANAASDIMDQAIRRLDSLGTLDKSGASDWDDLFNNLRERKRVAGRFAPSYASRLSNEELNLIQVVHDPIRRAIQTARAFGVTGVPSHTTPAGLWTNIQTAAEPPIGTSIGAKQNVTRTPPFKNRAEAGVVGVPLRDFVDAQQAAVGQLLKASADSWLSAAMEPFSKTLGELVDPALKARYAHYEGVRDKLRVLSKAIADAKVTGQFRQPRNIPPILQGFLDDALAAQKLRRKAERKAAFQKVRDDLAPVAKTIMEEGRGAKAQIASQSSAIQRAGGAGRYTENLNNRFYTESAGTQLRELEPKPVSDWIQKFNNTVRPLLATLDASFLGIQGLMGLSRNPKSFLSAMSAAFSSDAYDDLVKRATDSGLMDDFLKHDGVWLARHDMGEFLFPSMAEKLVPGARISNLWFKRFGNAMRLNLYESQLGLLQRTDPTTGLRAVASDEDKRALARNVSLATGYSPNPATRAENLALFAPRFFRSQLGLLSDALTFGKQGSTPLARDEARKMLRNLIIGGTAMTWATNQLLGKETDFDPTSPNFLRIKLPGNDVSVFGPWDTLLRAVSNSYKDGVRPDRGLEYLARSKASPAVSRVFDLIYGETFAGDTVNFDSPSSTLSSMAAMLKQSGVPISAQDAFETVEQAGGLSALDDTQALSEAGLGIVTSAAGLKSTPISARERRDILAQDTYGNRWRDLEPYQRSQLEKAYPDEALLRPQTADEEALQSRRAISLRFQDRQEALDANFEPGPDWVEAYSDLRREQSGAYEQWEAEHQSTAQRLQDRRGRGTMTSGEQALESYYELFAAARAENWTPDETTLALDQLQQSWSSEQSAYVERNTGLRDTPTVKQYKADMKALRPYFDIEDQVWDRINDQPQFSRYQSLNDYILYQAETLRSQGVPEPLLRYRVERLPVVRRFTSTVGDLRKRYRRANPEADSILTKWFATTPIAMQAR